jgi:hypothetical protein
MSPQAYLAAAASFDEGAFGITTNDDVQKELGVEDDSIVLLKHFDDKRADFKGMRGGKGRGPCIAFDCRGLLTGCGARKQCASWHHAPHGTR